MANTERNCSVLKLANTFERDDGGEELKDRDGNEDRGRYLDRFRNTSGSRVYMEPDISGMQAVRATIQT